jgi:glycerophosphoryl diester phosphodiesterase
MGPMPSRSRAVMYSSLSALSALLLFTVPMSAVEIIAHRGASYDAPENTLAALKLGMEQKADANELDVYLSKDGQVVLMHDATTKRTAGLDKPVVEQTLEELRTLDAGAWKGEQWRGEKIATLGEALATVPAGKRLFIEIKCGPEILPELERVLQASGKAPEQLVIISFGYDTVTQARQRFPKIPVFWLVSPKKGSKGKSPTVEEMIEQTRAAGLEGLNLNYQFPFDSAFVGKVKAAGLKLYAWTVDDAEAARKLVEFGVDGITTNRPAWLREQLQ